MSVMSCNPHKLLLGILVCCVTCMSTPACMIQPDVRLQNASVLSVATAHYLLDKHTFHASGTSTRRTIVMAASVMMPLAVKVAPRFTLLPWHTANSQGSVKPCNRVNASTGCHPNFCASCCKDTKCVCELVRGRHHFLHFPTCTSTPTVSTSTCATMML